MVYMKAYTPWSERSVASGIDTEKQINIPVKAKIELSRQHDEYLMQVTAQQTIASKVINK